MSVPKAFVRCVWVVVVTTFLVIIAGSVVRTTQSGMGCPDWPTCFGSAIPPTDSQQVVFQPNHAYKKGQFIIYNDSLKYAIQKFVSGSSYDPAQWKQYEKHNNANFSVLHTWIEFLNRLLGVLLGLFILVQVVYAYLLGTKSRKLFWLSFALILLTIFQAWLGKTVVDSNLALLKITLHMLGSLCMVFLGLYILFLSNGAQKVVVDKSIVYLNVALGLMVVSQLLMGTRVRGQIDNIVEHQHNINRSGWGSLLEGWFYIHRSFSLLIAVIVFYTVMKSKEYPMATKLCRRILAVVVLEILVGATLVYGGFPAAGQPLHLLLSSVLVALVFDNMLKLKIAK